MTHSKQELQELAQQIKEGRYVTKGTLYIAVVISLVIGLYLGNLLTTIYAPAPQQPVAQSRPAPATPQIDPGLAASILKYEKITRNDPGNVDAWTHLGHAYFDSDNPKGAIAAYTKSLALEPANPDVLTDLGVMYRRDGQPEMALAQFDKAITLNPRLEQAYFNKGVVLMHDMDRKADGIAAWKALLAINPNATAPNGTPVSSLIADHAQ